jgi:hypothetical protein
MIIEVGSVGLVVALKFYGADCVVSAGDWVRPAIISVPTEDVACFCELVREERTRLGS